MFWTLLNQLFVNGFKTKRNSKGNVECFKARLAVKGLLNMRKLTSMIHFYLFLEKTHLELLWP